MHTSTVILAVQVTQARRLALEIDLINRHLEEKKRDLQDTVREHREKRLAIFKESMPSCYEPTPEFVEDHAAEFDLGPRMTLGWSPLGYETKLFVWA